MTFLRFCCILHIFNMQKYIVKKVLATFLTFLSCREFLLYCYVKKNVFLIIVRGTTRPSNLIEVMRFFVTTDI